MKSVQANILLFTRYPQPGRSKTRLIPKVGALQAADIQRQMTKTILGRVSQYIHAYPCDLSIYYDGGSESLMSEWLGAAYHFKKQLSGDLGLRMASAIADQLAHYNEIVIIGSDCPAIDESILQQAFAALQHNDIVIGPAYDGGYYLIGVQGSIHKDTLYCLFSNINWGSSEVLQQTITQIRDKELSFKLLKKLHDIDTPEDLRYYNYNPNT